MNNNRLQFNFAGVFKAAVVAGLQASSGMLYVQPADARPLTIRNPAAPLPSNYTTDVHARTGCVDQIRQLQDTPEDFGIKHTTLTGCRVPVDASGKCAKPIGRQGKKGKVLLREPHKKPATKGNEQTEKTRANARTMLAVLSCDETKKRIQEEFIKNQSTPYEDYRQKVGAAILKIIKERNLKIDGVSLIIEDGVPEQEICMITDGRRKDHNPPRVVIVIDPKTCAVQGMHPMIKEVYCQDLCDEAARILEEHTPAPSTSSGSPGAGADRG